MERLKKQQITMPLDINETSEGYNSFVLVQKVNGKVRFCLDMAQIFD